MSIIALATGKLIKAPSTRTAKNGEPFTVASMRAASEDGDVLISLIAFGPAAQALAALGTGDALSITGKAKLTHWTGTDGQQRHGLSVTADAVMSMYQVRGKRQAATADSGAAAASPMRGPHATA